MWHEARKQEKKLRETMVNYQKRAERRKEHYDKLRGDPHQLLRVYGNKCKLHLDPKTASTLDSTMIPWQGDRAHIISPYDVRIHLDYIPDYSKLPEHIPSKEEKHEESRCNYERYRVLVQNTFHGLSEADALAKIAVEEMYPEPSKKSSKKSKSGGSAIGYSYDDNGDSSGKSGRQYKKPKEIVEAEDEEKGFSGESEYEVDMDVDSFNTFEVDKLNVIALDYKMPAGAFSKSLRAEKSDLLEQKMVRLAELEKTAISGKLSRRERKTWKESQQQAGGPLDNRPAYTVRGSPTYDPYEDEGSRSRSRSTSPEFESKVEYITEFGGNDEDTQPPATTSTATAADAGNGRNAAAASAELAPKSHSSSKSGKKMSSRHEESSTRSRSRDSSRRRDRRRRDSSDRDNYRSDRDRRRHRDYYSSSRRRSPEQYSRSSRYRNYSRSRSRDRYSRRYRDESYSRSRSRSRDRGRYRDRGRERERDRHSDRRRKHYSSSSSDSSRHYSRDKHKSHSHSNRKRSRSSSGYSGRSRSRSVSVSRNEIVEKPRSRSKSRSVTPQLPVPIQPQADPVEDLPSRIIQPSPPPAHSPVMMDLDQHNDRQEKNDEPIETRPVKQETKTPGKGKLSHRERLMKKMQAQLNKQHKMDKKAVKIKEKKKKAERMEREDQLREHQRKLKETHREELKEASYTYSGQAETYKMAAAAESDEESEGPSSPDSPTRLLMLGGGHSKNNKGTTKDNDFYYGRFS